MLAAFPGIMLCGKKRLALPQVICGRANKEGMMGRMALSAR